MILGNDMEPEFVDGTIITVDPSYQLISGAYVVALTNDGYCCKQYQQKEKVAYLKSLQGLQQIITQFEIKGVVIQSYRKGLICHYHYPKADVVDKFTKQRRRKKAHEK